MMAAAIIGSAAIGAASSYASGKAQAKAAERAAQAQLQMNRETIASQEKLFAQTRADALPWREAGIAALQQLQTGIADGSFDPSKFKFEADPGYQFRLAEGEKQIDRLQASRGNVFSGAAGKALARYGQEFASNEYDRAYARAANAKTTNFNVLSSVAGTGQLANSQIAQARDSMGNVIANANTNSGNALSQGYNQAGAAKASMYGNIAGAANQGLQNFMLYRYLG
jgi:hypothetical protein